MIYLVTWEIEISAESPEEAALEALRIQRDPRSIATVFKVNDEDEKQWMADLDAEFPNRVVRVEQDMKVDPNPSRPRT